MFKDKVIRNILILQIIGLILGTIFTVYSVVDGFEHLKMSWLVSQGYVPYRDFFEHHHPLLWYVYLPFTILLPHNIMLVFYFSRIFSLIFSVLMLYIICKIIERYMGGKQIIPYFLVLILAFYPTWWAFTVLKPEILARPLYFLGLYLFFRYAETFKTKYLIWTGIAFILAFLAIQNIIFSIIPLLIPLLYLWRKNAKVGKDILFASIAPLLIIGVFVWLLCVSGTWERYYQLCWIFNAHVFDLNYYTEPSYLWYYILPIILSIWAWVYQIRYKQASFYMNTIGLLFCFEIIQRIYFRAVFQHYLILMFIFMSLLCAPIFAGMKKLFVRQICYTVLISGLIISLLCLWVENITGEYEKLRLIHSNKNNSLANINLGKVNVWEPKNSYYVMCAGDALVDNFLFNYDESFDINKYLEENKIKYVDWIYMPRQFYLDYFSVLGIDADFVSRFIMSEESINKYVPIYEDLWQRKDTINNNIVVEEKEGL